MPRDFSNAKTSVFWDVEDYPIPNNRSCYEIIKSAIENLGYRGEVSITAYGQKEPNNLDGGIAFVPKSDKYWRLNKMLIDIAFWQMDNPDPHRVPTNLMVISKNIPEETQFFSVIEFLALEDYNVLFVVPNDCAPEAVPGVHQVWFWESLLGGGKPDISRKTTDLF